MIKWVKGYFNLKVVELLPWCYRIRTKLIFFSYINFQHIYREQNQLADELSKLALEGKEGALCWEEVEENSLIETRSINIFACLI